MSLLNIVMDEIVFLATASHSEVDSDVAIGRLESIAHALQQTSANNRRFVVTALLERAMVETDEARSALVDIAGLLEEELPQK